MFFCVMDVIGLLLKVKLKGVVVLLVVVMYGFEVGEFIVSGVLNLFGLVL